MKRQKNLINRKKDQNRKQHRRALQHRQTIQHRQIKAVNITGLQIIKQKVGLLNMELEK